MATDQASGLSPSIGERACALRVLHVASGDLWAGAEVQVYLLLRALRSYSMLSIKVVLMNDGELARRLRSIGVDVAIVDERLMSASRILRKLFRIIRDFRPAIIHTHRIKENLLGLTASLGTTSLVRTIHGRNEHTGGWRFPVRRLINFADTFTGKRLTDRVIAVSGELAGGLHAQGWRNVVRVSNGIDVSAVQGCQERPAFLSTTTAHSHIGFVGRLEPVKRPDLFVRTAACARANGLEGVQWHVFGDGSQRQRLEADAERLGIGDSVIFYGHSDRVVRWLGSLNCLVIPSDHEGTPMVLLEALAAGAAVIGHAVGGIKEVLGGAGLEGWLVGKQSPDAYLRAVMALLRTERHPTAVEAVRDYIRANFSIEQTAEQTLRVYEDLCNR